MNPERSSDAAWLEHAVERYRGPLTRYAALITGDAERARDVVQDTFVRLCHQSRDRVEPHLAEWLFTVCRHRALDVQRKERRMKRWDEADLGDCAGPGASPSAEAERRESTSTVLRLMAGLPHNQQEVVRLKFQNGLSYAEISRITNLSVSNVGFLIHTAIRSLRRQLAAVSSPARLSERRLS